MPSNEIHPERRRRRQERIAAGATRRDGTSLHSEGDTTPGEPDVWGDPEQFLELFSVTTEDSFDSVKAMPIENVGCLVRSQTVVGGFFTSSLVWVPNTTVVDDYDDTVPDGELIGRHLEEIPWDSHLLLDAPEDDAA
jgi:hypothetical protein